MTQNQHTDDQRREEIRQRVINESSQAFRTQGIRNVTMDDIAHRLTMSKRTLYQLFADKQELLLACVKQHVESDDRRMAALMNHPGANVLDLLLQTIEGKLREAEEVHPCFFEDMLRYPSVMAFFDHHKHEREDAAVAFLNQGKEEGYFRPEVNFKIVYRQIILGCDRNLMNDLLKTYSRREVLANTIVPYIRGCATIKGIHIIDDFMSNHLSAALRYKAPEEEQTSRR